MTDDPFVPDADKLAALRSLLVGGPEGTTAEHAVDRLDRFLRTARAVHDDFEAEETVAAPPVGLEDAETRLGISCPDELRAFLESVGVWRHESFGEQLLRVLPPREWLGLMRGVEAAWGGRGDVVAALGPEETARLNAEYVLFGYHVLDDNTHQYFVFDRRGGFDAVPFHQDSYDEDFLPFVRQGLGRGLTWGAVLSDAVTDRLGLLWESHEDVLGPRPE